MFIHLFICSLLSFCVVYDVVYLFRNTYGSCTHKDEGRQPPIPTNLQSMSVVKYQLPGLLLNTHIKEQ
jgi:hypothetical protein